MSAQEAQAQAILSQARVSILSLRVKKRFNPLKVLKSIQTTTRLFDWVKCGKYVCPFSFF